jgi:hypothetical protein
LLLAPILALAQFDEETGRWGNSCLAVQRMQQQLQVNKVAGEFLRSSRSPPGIVFSIFNPMSTSLLEMMRVRFF